MSASGYKQTSRRWRQKVRLAPESGHSCRGPASARQKPRLVTYNGRSFDLPVLKYRAMMHGVQASWLHQGGDRFNN